ncbi:hypothetical protein BJ684DRAFT_16771, partial [Piptocephalis cylindrospora]
SYTTSSAPPSSSSSSTGLAPGIRGFNKVILLGDVQQAPEPVIYSRGALSDMPGLEFYLRTRRTELNDQGNEVMMEDCHRVRCTDPKYNKQLQNDLTPGSIIMVEGRIRYEKERETQSMFIVPTNIKYIGNLDDESIPEK